MKYFINLLIVTLLFNSYLLGEKFGDKTEFINKPLSTSTKKFDGKKYALVIGNSDYKKDELKNPINDAVAFSQKLKELSFNVDLSINVDIKEMRDNIRKFAKKLNKEDVVIFFYAGHAVQYEGGNYLLPIGAISQVKQPKELLTKTISLKAVLKTLNKKSKLKIIILDSCRTSPFKQFADEIKSGLARSVALKLDSNTNDDKIEDTFNKFLEGTLIAYSTSPGHISHDGSGKHSPYTKYLLKNITQQNFTIEKILKKTRANVEEETTGFQTPWYESSINGEFYPAGTNSIEFIDLLKTFILNENASYSIGGWNDGASKYSPIEWEHDGVQMENFTSYRLGKVYIKNQGVFSHFRLNIKDEPVKWSVKMIGSNAGYSEVHLFNDTPQSIYSSPQFDEGLRVDGMLRLDKRYIKKKKVLCHSPIPTDLFLIEAIEIKLPNKRLSVLLTQKYCAGSKSLCQYQYKLFPSTNLNNDFTKDSFVKECIEFKKLLD